MLKVQAILPVISPDEMAGHYSENDVSAAVRRGLFQGPDGAYAILAKRVADSTAENRESIRLDTLAEAGRAFFELASNDNVVASDLAGGIYEAMITTAAGLAVGIVAYIAYNLLVALVEKVVYNMEATSVEFMDLLQEPAA